MSAARPVASMYDTEPCTAFIHGYGKVDGSANVCSEFASTKTMPTISVGWRCRNSRARIPPHEWANMIYGGGISAALRRAESSWATETAVVIVSSRDFVSDFPRPEQS